MIYELNEKNFDESIEHGIKLVEFYASWCPYCRQEDNVLNALTNTWVGKVNSDNNSKLVVRHQIMGYPTFLLFKNGIEKARFSGFHDKNEIEKIIFSYTK